MLTEVLFGRMLGGEAPQLDVDEPLPMLRSEHDLDRARLRQQEQDDLQSDRVRTERTLHRCARILAYAFTVMMIALFILLVAALIGCLFFGLALPRPSYTAATVGVGSGGGAAAVAAIAKMLRRR